MPKIIVQFGGEEWSVDLREGVNVAGRSPQAAISIRDASMSREHCEVVLEGGVATVVDRGSMNGTIVNGSRVDRKDLAPGDRIQIGKASLFFETKPGGSAAGAKAAAEPVVGIDDFSVWRRESGSALKIAGALAILGVLAVGATLLFKSLGSGAVVAGDPGNVLGLAGRFDPGPEGVVVGWAMKPGQASRIQAVEGAARQGKTCLQLEKSSAATDLAAEVLYQEILAVPSPGSLEVSAWARTESTGVLPSLKATWLAARKGPILLEEWSGPSPGSSDWSQLAHTFAPPPGAGFVQLSLVAMGRSGRVLFDDVRARFGSGGAPITSEDLGGYRVSASPAGVLSIEKESRRIVSNLQLFLASEKEGTIHQAAATGARVESDASRKVTATGKLPSPVDLRPIEFEIDALAGKDSLLLGFQLRGDALKQVDRLGLALLLPGGDLKGDYTNHVPRLWFRSGGSADFILEISDGLMKMAADYVPEARRVALAIPIPKGASEMRFGFQLKPGVGGMMDPLKAVDQLIQQEQMSQAVDMLKDVLAATREEEKRRSIGERLRALEDTEASDWQSVQAQRFMAELVGLKPHFERALQNLDRYLKRWPAGRRAEAAKAEREKLTTGLAAAAEDRETLRANRLMDRAEEHRKDGQTGLARELCETVRRHYGQTTAAARAAEMLKTLAE